MIIYNVTVKIESSIHDDWLQWMTQKHIQDVMDTGLFTDAQIRRLLIDHEDGDTTYSIQYRLKSMDDLQQYQDQHAKRLQAEHTERYKGKYVAFRTLMEEIQTY